MGNYTLFKAAQVTGSILELAAFSIKKFYSRVEGEFKMMFHASNKGKYNAFTAKILQSNHQFQGNKHTHDKWKPCHTQLRLLKQFERTGTPFLGRSVPFLAFVQVWNGQPSNALEDIILGMTIVR